VKGGTVRLVIDFNPFMAPINLIRAAWLDFKIKTSLPMSPYLGEYLAARARLRLPT
jgi:hypothetical protein